jgi:hypothetical protein
MVQQKFRPRVVFYTVLFAMLIFSIFLYIYSLNEPESPFDNYEALTIRTDKWEYTPTEKAIIIIENTSDKKACFSSCYPFYLEKQEASWQYYRYDQCPEDNIADICVNPYDKKAFEVFLGDLWPTPASHRFVISTCFTCNEGDKFKMDEIFFSNVFKIE